ncbi:MAG: bifunctional riboflavin kinase/FAD synthetase, partial [Candidatus Omnitrophota bacterium]
GYKNESPLNDPVVAIGIFDGIHIGHKRLIKRLMNYPGRGRDKVVVTFDPHPETILRPKKTPPRIMSLDHRLSIFGKMGLDAAVIIHFSHFIASMTPEEFIQKVIIQGLGARTIYVGGNFHFGHGGSGNIEMFRMIGKEYGLEVHTVPPVKKSGKIVSSTWLRKLITRGDLKKAETLLRRPVSVLGTVVKGDERGRAIGIPTANIDPHQEVIPPPGVYAVKADIEGKMYDGLMNIGFRPTFYGRKPLKRKEPHIEVHVFDLNRDLYGSPMEIFFIKKLRKERKFRKAEDLVRQINKDAELARKFLSCNKVLHRIRKYKPA